MSLRDLDERLTALQETTTQLRELIDRLAKLDFQPGAGLPLDMDDESSVSGELSAEIGQILRNGLEEQELLTEEVQFVRPEGAEKMRLREGVERLGSELASCRTHFRKARLSARDNLAQARKLERRLLIQSYSLPVPSEPDSPGSKDTPEEASSPTLRSPQRLHHTHAYHHNQSSLSAEDQQTVGASNNVTSALRRTHDLIAAELFRSEYAHQTLTESSAALRELDESYSSLDSMLASSRDLLGTLLRSQKSDTWYLQTALYMLLATGAWLLFRRILYGPMWWLVWLPLRVLFGVGTRAGSAVMMHHRSAPGGSATASVGGGGAGADGGSVSVDGLPGEDLVTAQVGSASPSGRDGIAEVVTDQIAQVVDAVREADELGNVGERDADEGSDDQPRNPMKRMWEEPQEELKEEEVNEMTDGEPDDQPRNPKKRMWEEPQEEAKREDEAEVVQETQQRDEL
ncbi:hypothetical protein E4U57_002136 [Claviceps arundinis]|uniref:Sec20 C-terminal domain-containing protein n=1 Tax=Claviceps arundinis TaxID=1623583 RepID=A0A9P7SSA1_9HYPO|nr:hypothetical protein E4U57_002136 [Claviceps arundinis]KAG5971107.1 hypothetical protein E4U56_007078 [Claviceps arundinis]